MGDENKLTAVVVSSFSEAHELSRSIAGSKLLPTELQSNPADVLVTILAGQELGLSPMASIRGIHVIQGKPTLSADMMVAIVRRSGMCEYWTEIESTDQQAVYETKRKEDAVPVRSKFTMADAKAAQLLGKPGSNWTKHPAAMLRARAKSALARRVYEDVLFGCYDPDELAHSDPPVTRTEYTSPIQLPVKALPPGVPCSGPPGEDPFDRVSRLIEEAACPGDLDAAVELGGKLPPGDDRKALAEKAVAKKVELRKEMAD